MSMRFCGGLKSGRMVGLATAIIFSGGILSATENIVLTGPKSTGGPAPYYSPGVAEVLSLLGGKVSPDVVKTYIKTSSSSFDLGPQTVIGLRNMGVSDEIVNALLQRDAELKEKVAKVTEASYNYTPPQPPEMPGYEGQPEYAGYGDNWSWGNLPWWFFEPSGRQVGRFDRFGRFNNFSRNPNRNVFLTPHQPSGVGGAPPPGVAGTPPGIGGQMPRGAIPAPGGITRQGAVGGKSGGGVGGAMGGGGSGGVGGAMGGAGGHR